MQTGMNLLLWTSHVTAQHFPLLGKLKQAGYDGVEIPLFEGDAAHFKTVQKELANQGLRCTTVTVVNADTNPVSPDAAVRKAALAADVLRQAAEFAAKQKVNLAIEYLNRFECYFLTTAADAKALVQRVGHPSFRMMYDTFHSNIEEKNVSQAIADIAGQFIHVHISENDRGTPGSGLVHWEETFKALRKTGYDGWLVIESFGRALPDLAAATKVWRDLFPSPEDVYLKGLKFMKEMWAKAK